MRAGSEQLKDQEIGLSTNMTQALTPETLVPATEPTFYFIGVTTGSSSIMKVFPKWAEHLGISKKIVGIDIALDADPAVYRKVVEFIKNDSLSLGALVTSHKLNLFKATKDLFEEIGESAKILDEISCISKRGEKLLGHAMDDVTAGLSLKRIAPGNYFLKTDGELLIFGAGGSSLALTLFLHREKLAGRDTPSRIVVTNRRPHRLVEMKEVHERIGFSIPIEYIEAPDPSDNDRALTAMRPFSVIANATGLGKDRPGSPISHQVVFPMDAIAWDFNYRGDLVFLDQAATQNKYRRVTPVNGWFYFLHGWTRVIDQVFDIRIPTEGPEFNRLSDIAAKS